MDIKAAEELDVELGSVMGDARRCPRHPGQKTSSNDGMFDSPCGMCELEAEDVD